MGRILIPFHVRADNLPSDTYYQLVRLYQQKSNSAEVLSPEQALKWARECYREWNLEHFFEYWFPNNSLGSLGGLCLEELFETFHCPTTEDSAELCDKCYKETLYIY